MVNDPIADTLIQIKNGYLSKKETLEIPYSSIKSELLKLLTSEGYIQKVEIKNDETKKLVVALKYENNNPVFNGVKKISKSGLRVYISYKNIPIVLNGLGITIISTPKGLMTGSQAKKNKMGGEFICKIW